MTTIRGLFVLAVVACLSLPSVADDAKPKKKAKPGAEEVEGKKARGRAVGGAAFAVPKGIELSDEQQEQVAALRKEYAPKMREIAKKIGLSADQRKAMAEARKAAAADGKKGKEAREAINAAVNLSDEQKAAQAEMQELAKEIRGKVMDLLTEDQKAKLPKRGGGKKAKDKKAA